jgi:hypothetical protein
MRKLARWDWLQNKVKNTLYLAIPEMLMLQYSPPALWVENWGMVQRQHSGLWIRLFWFESGCPSLNYLCIVTVLVENLVLSCTNKVGLQFCTAYLGGASSV